ncbi:uncharacterized protein BX663DRAFT_501302 [Cokeromyces recurvatus]|uniref:uncharacterized protein n=1 Tax=Cokeromyces recurvatus TaxID=90255 RepID=UPI002220DA51|nr:uncharacterized protein BX663DRAFT_501302 [Cokeromyces recurvatus]KAI7904998.1 hypothetical protein BX663DRAFT_501302 [Cokeromyces recurvatus]
MSNNNDTLHHRLTPAHIHLSAWLPNDKKGKWQKVKEEISKDKGTFCIATQQIKQGEFLLTEEPFIRQLNKEHHTDRCNHCFRKLKDKSIECHNSSCKWNIYYCSLECERQGWSRSHQWLCRFPELAEEEPDVLFAFEGYITSRSKGKDTLPGLISHLESTQHNQLKEYQKRFENLASLFFLSKHSVDSLITILLQIKYNTFSIKTTESVLVESSSVISREFIQLGRAIYLSASRLNHNCNPNALISFSDYNHPCQLKVQSVQTMERGQEITISYGPLATKHNRQERLKTLKDNYLFDCQCSNCHKEEVVEEEENRLDTSSPDKMFKCQICKEGRLYRQQSKCSLCGQHPYWGYFLKTEAEIEEYKKIGDYHKVLQLQETIYYQYTIPIGLTVDKLAQIYCMQSEWRLACQYSQRSLKIAEIIYGKMSVEVAEEMMKLSTILFNS